MNFKSKNRPGVAGLSGGGDSVRIGLPLFYHISPNAVNPGALQTLIDQAGDMMTRHPADFGRHSKILQSLIYLKNGWPWPPVGGAL